jgi:thymidylate synthase
MRYYQNARELYSEMMRDLWELGSIVKPKSYQNKNIEGDDKFITKELQNYSYRLLALPDPDNLFLLSHPDSKEWCLQEFGERVNPHAGNPGEAWKIRKDEWEPLLNDEGRMDYTYSERINYNNAIQDIITELKRNSDTRQAWLPIFHPKDIARLGGKGRIPCSLGYFFSVRNGKLNLTYVQRSADLVMHFGNDIWLAWMMKTYIASMVGVEPGFLEHIIFSLHSYKRDWLKLEDGISKL